MMEYFYLHQLFLVRFKQTFIIKINYLEYNLASEVGFKFTLVKSEVGFSFREGLKCEKLEKKPFIYCLSIDKTVSKNLSLSNQNSNNARSRMWLANFFYSLLVSRLLFTKLLFPRLILSGNDKEQIVEIYFQIKIHPLLLFIAPFSQLNRHWIKNIIINLLQPLMQFLTFSTDVLNSSKKLLEDHKKTDKSTVGSAY